MTVLRNKIAQMLIIGFSGLELDDNNPVAEWIRHDGLGGVLLFDVDLQTKTLGKNLKNAKQIKRLNHDLQQCAAMAGHAWPLLIAVDYEGGAVDRLSTIPGCMPSMKALEQAALSTDAFQAEARKMALTLKELGFNLNFAPVVDLHLNDQKGIIGTLGRSFSEHPAVVARMARVFVDAFREQGILCAYKHFPGHGSAIGDTHEGFVDVTDTYQPSELEPYAALLGNMEWPVMVMTAHVINRVLDQSGVPATLSYPILTELLRHQLGFDGVVVSDDLQMQAISHHYSIDEALSLTINAGADMVILGNQWGSITATEVIDKIEQLVRSGVIPPARIDDAYRRIGHLKQALSVCPNANHTYNDGYF